MAAVTEDQLITAEGMKKIFGGPVAPSVTLWSGTIAFIDATNGHLTDTANGGANAVAGVVPSRADNSAGGAGDINSDVYVGPYAIPLAGVVQADVGKRAFAVDNYTASLTGAGNSYLGTIRSVVADGVAMIDIDRHAPSEA